MSEVCEGITNIIFQKDEGEPSDKKGRKQHIEEDAFAYRYRLAFERKYPFFQDGWELYKDPYKEFER